MLAVFGIEDDTDGPLAACMVSQFARGLRVDDALLAFELLQLLHKLLHKVVGLFGRDEGHRVVALAGCVLSLKINEPVAQLRVRGPRVRLHRKTHFVCPLLLEKAQTVI